MDQQQARPSFWKSPFGVDVIHTAVAGTAMARGAAKAAELAAGLGAVVLGAGLALLMPDILRGFAIPILVAGILSTGPA